ncbi:50S ribosomal protein L18 [Geodia barretti]|uniref:Large ribosomal subunit protein uL18c n=1 Tax=Geodia barretti TaxID=519541 RepID=A0AA35SNL7_GEOBA|nr:50S ribosomal protein L18 [Geodia barretti]
MRPRLAVSRSLAHISVQLIDDQAGRTLVAASSQENGARGSNVAGAWVVGRVAAERLLEQGVKQAVFDRGGRLYHGRVRRVAEAARDAGLEF